ncbi:DUF547 domain-containing protein [Candidatus Uabimicrobium amorphum]|uniref:DUF547 domain-containing protein n=1 Tax=Uabimicrobium amorphum TaxID=2596890 RepID=A0A5S9IQM7_UABAM|nr:DUF547 domain-containing protein [Candidatus Uabimicrobium amorphum]BBM86124.1 DUF547 domain-containing protein [Candidatus Uabimicrobium amorphum]
MRNIIIIIGVCFLLACSNKTPKDTTDIVQTPSVGKESSPNVVTKEVEDEMLPENKMEGDVPSSDQINLSEQKTPRQQEDENKVPDNLQNATVVEEILKEDQSSNSISDDNTDNNLPQPDDALEDNDALEETQLNESNVEEFSEDETNLGELSKNETSLEDEVLASDEDLAENTTVENPISGNDPDFSGNNNELEEDTSDQAEEKDETPAVDVPQENAYVRWTNKYGKLLQGNVAEGRAQNIRTVLVDYQRISSDPSLDELYRELGALPSFSNEEQDMRLAMWINAYNFLTIFRVAKNPAIKTFNDLQQGEKNVWKQPAGKVAGNTYTLDEIEHEVIRKKFQEPRIHFALVCAALGCPDLRNEPYTSKKLEKQLQEQLIRYLQNDKKGMRVANNTVYLSQIFSWFKEDFAGDDKQWLMNEGLLTKNARQYQVEYIDYNWALNNSLFDDRFIQEYIADQDKSLLSIITHKAGVAAYLAHDHMIYATAFESTLKCNPNFVNSVQFSVKIPVDKLYNDLFSLQKTWYPRLKTLAVQTSSFSEVSKSDREKIRTNMLSSSQLDSKKYAAVTAKVQKIVLKNSDVGSVKFPFLARVAVTIKDKTVVRDMPTRIYFEKGALRIETVGKLKFTDFGITPYSAFFGAIKNGDEFHLYVNLRSK